MSQEIGSAILRVIEKYGLFKKGVVPIAFSGGKDSATCLFALRELGFQARPVIVDRNDDELFDSESLAEILEERNFQTAILNLRDEKFLSKTSKRTREAIAGYLAELDGLEKGGIACTPCYNARTSALEHFSQKIGSGEYGLGMHRNDFLSYLVRFYWIEKYYLNFTEPDGIAYEQARMERMIEESQIDLDYLAKMVDEERAATDDPPIEKLKSGVRMARLLVEVDEEDIIEFSRKFNFPVTSSNCKFRQSETATPLRLIVQNDLKRRITSTPGLREELYFLAMKSVARDGTLRFRPRNSIQKNYPGFNPRIRNKI